MGLFREVCAVGVRPSVLRGCPLCWCDSPPKRNCQTPLRRGQAWGQKNSVFFPIFSQLFLFAGCGRLFCLRNHQNRVERRWRVEEEVRHQLPGPQRHKLEVGGENMEAHSKMD